MRLHENTTTHSLVSMQGQKATGFHPKYALKMNEGLMGLEQHEGEWLMTELLFLCEQTLSFEFKGIQIENKRF